MVFQSRICGEDLYHHIYAWGNDRHSVFRSDYHYRNYLAFLEKYSKVFEIEVIAYALMEWHVHLFIHDLKNNLSEFMMKFHGEYAQFFNRNTSHVGHVFGERFNNKIVQANEYGTHLSRYIHLQAVKAGLVDNPRQYNWSSYHVYIGLEKSRFIKPGLILDQFGDDDAKYRRYDEFVLGEDEGPIDWDKKTTITYRIEYIINSLCCEMAIERSALMNPRGYKQKANRHRLIKKLHVEYNFKPLQIAHAFNLSRPTISVILKINE